MLTPAQKAFFDESGYLVVEGVFQGELLASLQRESEALAATASPETKVRVWRERALFRRKAFRDALDAERLIAAATDLIGDDVQLLALDLLLARPGHRGVGWHRDVTFVCNKTLSINTGVYLYDMTEEMGPLRVAPGSHRWEENPPASTETLTGEAQVPTSAGDAVFFDAALWHRGGRNNTNQNRLGLFAYFGRYWIKRMDNYFTQPLPADLLYTKHPMKRQLLGLGLRPGAPNYHGDDENYNRRGEPGIDFPSD
jgi:ectoine hydroxylase-related dioxygenase (phytanoyl-CoA dioxygenase family)